MHLDIIFQTTELAKVAFHINTESLHNAVALNNRAFRSLLWGKRFVSESSGTLAQRPPASYNYIGKE